MICYVILGARRINSDRNASLPVEIGPDTTTLGELVSNANGSNWLHSVYSIMADTNGEKRFDLLQAVALALAGHSSSSTSKVDQTDVNALANLCAAKHSATNNILDVRYTDGTTALERAFRAGHHAIALLFYNAVEKINKSRPIASDIVAKAIYNCKDGEDFKVAVEYLSSLMLSLVRVELSDARKKSLAKENGNQPQLPVPFNGRIVPIAQVLDILLQGGGSKEERKIPDWLRSDDADCLSIFVKEIERPLLAEAMKASQSLIYQSNIKRLVSVLFPHTFYFHTNRILTLLVALLFFIRPA